MTWLSWPSSSPVTGCWRLAARPARQPGRCSSAASPSSASRSARSWQSAHAATWPGFPSRSTWYRSKAGRGGAGSVRPRLRRDRLALGRSRDPVSPRLASSCVGVAASRSGARHTRSLLALTHSSARFRRSYDAIGEGHPGEWPPPPPDTAFRTTRAEIEASGLFDQVAVHRYVWETLYTTDEYIALLNTFSGHIAMEQVKREHLYGEIRQRVGQRPDPRVRRHWYAILHVARRGEDAPARSGPDG